MTRQELETNHAIAAAIIALLRAQGVTQKLMAAKAGVSDPTATAWARGGGKPTAEHIACLRTLLAARTSEHFKEMIGMLGVLVSADGGKTAIALARASAADAADLSAVFGALSSQAPDDDRLRFAECQRATAPGMSSVAIAALLSED